MEPCLELPHLEGTILKVAAWLKKSSAGGLDPLAGVLLGQGLLDVYIALISLGQGDTIGNSARSVSVQLFIGPVAASVCGSGLSS